MRRRNPVKAAIVLGIALTLLSVAPAIAAPADATVVSSRTEKVSGYDMAAEALKSLEKVAVGSNGATVTLDVDGSPQVIAMDLGDMIPGGGASGGAGGIGGIAIIAAVAAAIFRGATFLVRLMR